MFTGGELAEQPGVNAVQPIRKSLIVRIEIADVEPEGERLDRPPRGLDLHALIDLLAGVQAPR